MNQVMKNYCLELYKFHFKLKSRKIFFAACKINDYCEIINYMFPQGSVHVLLNNVSTMGNANPSRA